MRLYVRARGLEPPHLAAPDPKSGVSTNSTTPADVFSLSMPFGKFPGGWPALVISICLLVVSGCKYKYKFESANGKINFFSTP